MYRNSKEILIESFGIVKTIPKICELCHAKLERKSLYQDTIMHKRYNQETGKRDGKTFFIDTIINNYKDRNHYLLVCTKCSLFKEVIISYKTYKTSSHKKRKVIQIF